MLTDCLEFLGDFFSVQNLGHFSFAQPHLEGGFLAIGASTIAWLKYGEGVGTDLIEEWHIWVWKWLVRNRVGG